MTENGVFSEYQYGFRKARSCSDLLVATIDDWHLAQDANKFTAIAFIDLSKAFHRDPSLALSKNFRASAA